MLSWGLRTWAVVIITLAGCVDLTRPDVSLRSSGDGAVVNGVGGGGAPATPNGVGGSGGGAKADALPPISSGPPDPLAVADGGTQPAVDQRPVEQGQGQGPVVAQGPPAGMDAAVPKVDVPVSTPSDAGGGTAKLGMGVACAAGSACQSGFCADGVCCESQCGSLCYSCRLSGQTGSCRPVAAGVDPDNECAEASVASCGSDGSCNGAGACRLRGAGTVCGTGSCTGSTASDVPKCNGTGQCAVGAESSCAPYVCGGGACRTNCSSSADCVGGSVCSGGSCFAGTSVLVVDDFSDANLLSSTMGGWLTWDNQNVALVGGELRFAYNGSGGFQDFIEAFNSNFCAYDLRPYRTLRFRMRASSGVKSVRVFMTFTNSTCSPDSNPLVKTISVTPTMTTFDVDLSALVRDKSIFVEISPPADATEYFLDDIHLIK